MSSALWLTGCAPPRGDPPLPAPLADDRARPALALIEQVLSEHFAAQAGAAGPTTTCVSLAPEPLTADDEAALMGRFVRLAPASRCRPGAAGPSDAIVGTPAELIQVYEFACQSDERCAGWVTRSGRPATRYAMEWRDGAWRFTADRRLLAE
ncbi:MAG: hypothetical protein B7Z08_09265 [Sphingomonadales bacterium 32-68-7]|nr:MAG: hypothetical protein B7Z33_11900 [Sphingomonadales bacterium 12-68-11]OYX08486.1 MAG: hypothetical protein B7Z08_09265 [Sphingomonadales bacterium 32-68-7]